MNGIRIVFVSASLLLTFNQTYSMGILNYISFLSYRIRTKQKAIPHPITLREFNSDSEEYLKHRDRALYSLYIETVLKKHPTYRPEAEDYSPDEIGQFEHVRHDTYPDFKSWCKSNYNVNPFYPRTINHIAECEGKKCWGFSVIHDSEFINYYVKAWRNILNEQERIQLFKDQIDNFTTLLEQKPQPLTKHQSLIQQAKAGLTIDEFVKANKIPDKGFQETNVVGDIGIFWPAILDHDTLKDFDLETRKVSLRNYLDISKSVARENRKVHFEKIIKDNLFLNPEFKFKL